MKLVSFKKNGAERFGLVKGDMIADLTGLEGYQTLLDVIEAGALADIPVKAANMKADIPLSSVQLLPPITRPRMVMCVGINYPSRNEEYKDGVPAGQRPSLFLRVPNSFVGSDNPIHRPPESEQLDYEAELTIIIGKQGRRIPKEKVYEHIVGVTLANEGTIRDWVRHSKFNITQGKNFDGTGSIGPWMVTTDEVDLKKPLRIVCKVNGEERQNDTTDRMTYDIPYLVNYISTFATLHPGDVILTGTPTGAGARFEPPIWLKPGDVLEITVPEIGTLRNTIADEPK